MAPSQVVLRRRDAYAAYHSLVLRPTFHSFVATTTFEAVQRSAASQFQILAFPTFQREFSKPEVRRPISMAIDRDEIIRSIFKDSQQSARSFVSPVVSGYRDNTCGVSCEFNPAKAKDSPCDDGNACTQIKTNLGVECTGQPDAKFSDLLTKVQNKEAVGMFRMGWVMDYPSMENYLGPLYTTNGSSNYYGYSNKEFDDLVQAGREAPTSDEAIKKWQQAEDILAKDIPVLPMRFGQNNFGISEKVKDVNIDLFNRVDLTKIQTTGN